MPRKLKHHEEKLLRKVDFITWKQDNDHRDAAVRRRYMIQKPEGTHFITAPSTSSLPDTPISKCSYISYNSAGANGTMHQIITSTTGCVV